MWKKDIGTRRTCEMKNMTDTLKGIVLTSAGFSLFAIGDTIFKILSESYAVAQNVVLIGSVSMVLYLLAAHVMGGVRNMLRTNHLKLHLFRGLLFTVQVLAVMYAFAHLPLATVYVLIFITPVLTVLGAIFLLGENVARSQWMAIFFGLAGILVVMRPGVVPLEFASVAVLVSALMTALANLIVRKMGEGESILSFGLYPQAVLLLILGLWVAPSFEMPVFTDWLFILCGGVLSAGGLMGIVLGFRLAKASVVAPFHYIQILWGVVLGYFVFGDVPDWWALGGGVIVIASGLWLIRHERKNIPDISGPP